MLTINYNLQTHYLQWHFKIDKRSRSYMASFSKLSCLLNLAAFQLFDQIIYMSPIYVRRKSQIMWLKDRDKQFIKFDVISLFYAEKENFGFH